MGAVDTDDGRAGFWGQCGVLMLRQLRGGAAGSSHFLFFFLSTSPGERTNGNKKCTHQLWELILGIDTAPAHSFLTLLLSLVLALVVVYFVILCTVVL